MNRVCILAFCTSVLLLGCSSAPEEPAAEFKAISTTQDVMEGLIAHAAQEIWDAVRIEIDQTGTHEYKPETKEDWQEIGYVSRGLAEAASLLLYDGRIEDHGDWLTFTNEMRETALMAAKAADDQDPDELLSVGGDIYEVCTKCHEAYLERVEMRRTGGNPDAAPLTAPPGAK